jgi:hypothetical protein
MVWDLQTRTKNSEKSLQTRAKNSEKSPIRRARQGEREKKREREREGGQRCGLIMVTLFYTALLSSNDLILYCITTALTFQNFCALCCIVRYCY